LTGYRQAIIIYTKQDPTPQFLEQLPRTVFVATDHPVRRRPGEVLGVGDVEALRKEAPLAPGFSPLDPTIPKRGKYNRRRGLLVNVEMRPW
jgi:predicted transcriptional regulator of viral defense system